MKNKRSKKILIKISIILIVLLAISVIVLLGIQEGVLEGIKRKIAKPQMFEIKDECLLILNNIIHQIKDEDECKIFCKNNCQLRNLNFNDVNFIIGNNSCHTCNCYCK